MKLSDKELNWLSSGTLLLTPNLRLSRAWVAFYGQHQQASGNRVWEPPAIFAIDAWLQQQWQCLDYMPAILSGAQAMLLWEQVIADLSPSLNAHSVVTAAEQAYELCYCWQLDKESPAFLQNDNSREWAKWANEFEKRIASKGYVSRQQAIHQLITAAKKGQLKKQSLVVLIGFDSLAPLYLELLHLLFDSVEFQQSAHATTDIVRCVLNDADDEIMQAAQYAKKILTQDSAASIGIIVHDLTNRRARIEKILMDVFETQAVLPDRERYALPFNFSAGEPLNHIPIVRVALLLFTISGRALSLELVLSLLKSPFIKGYRDELVARSMLASKLLELNRNRVSLDKLMSLAADFSLDRTTTKYQCLQLVDGLIKIKALVSQQQKRLPSQWASYFMKVLEAVGYTSDTINSIEYQQRTQFLEQVSQLETLDDLLGECTHAHANRLVSRLVQQGVFQPKTKRSPIQVLGLLEGAGLQFTHVWITGMHDKAWPPAPNPNPFIPFHLQRDKNMPHATAARELTFIYTLFAQYLAGAQHMVVSYPAQEEGQNLRASSLIKHYPIVDEASLIDHTSTTFIKQIYETRVLESFDDIDASAVEKNEPTRGGTSILKDQSLCAFRAFAHHRLKAKAMESVDEGLTKAERGTLLHACMQHVWNTLGNHAQLISLSDEALEAVVLESIKNETAKLPKEIGNQFIEIENQRLLQLILLWLDIEKARTPFSVKGVEVNEKIPIGNLILNVYVDRIDEVDGAQVVIDYKTSGKLPSLSVWKGDRPDDPQLPLYAIAGEGEIRGIYFAHVTSKNRAYIGISEENALIPMKPTTFKRWEKDMGSWPEAIEKWKAVLEKLANDFVDGKASIDPTRTACDYCHLSSLCRIHLGDLS